MAKIFLSYRRDDTQGEAGHLMAELRRRYGPSSVFMDIGAIEPGADFAYTIERAMLDSEVVLVLIGKAWLDARDARSRRRLEDPRDWVRLEVELALANRRRLIPVLVQGSQMPAEEALPESMRPMARLNAHEISARRWDYDFQALASVMDRLFAGGAPADSPTAAKPTAKFPRKLLVGGGLIGAVATLVTALYSVGWIGSNKPDASKQNAEISAQRNSRSDVSMVEALQAQVAELERQISILKSAEAQNPTTTPQAKARELQDDRDKIIREIDENIRDVDQRKRAAEQALPLTSGTIERAKLESEIRNLSQMRQALQNIRDTTEELSKDVIRWIKV